MKVEVKSIKHCASLSHETLAFTCKVYVNGNHVGEAENSGHGGCTDVRTAWKGEKDEKGYPLYSDADKKAVDDLYEWAKDNNKYGLEGLIDDIVQEELNWRDFQSLKRTKVVYYSAEKNSIMGFKKPKTITQDDINSGEFESALQERPWWKEGNVFLNSVKKAEFIDKYMPVWAS